MNREEVGMKKFILLMLFSILLPLSVSFAVTGNTSIYDADYSGFATMTPTNSDNFSDNFICYYVAKLIIYRGGVSWQAQRLPSPIPMNDECPGEGSEHKISFDSKVLNTATPGIVDIPHYYNGIKSTVFFDYDSDAYDPLVTYGYPYNPNHQIFHDGNKNFLITECFGNLTYCEIR